MWLISELTNEDGEPFYIVYNVTTEEVVPLGFKLKVIAQGLADYKNYSKSALSQMEASK